MKVARSWRMSVAQNLTRCSGDGIAVSGVAGLVGSGEAALGASAATGCGTVFVPTVVRLLVLYA